MELPPDLYFNRELSWLRFNTRVLDQVCDESLPLLERLKFLAIYGTNLDEFYMIRVAGLKHLYDHSVVQEGLQMGHGKQLECIRSYLVAEQKNRARAVFATQREISPATFGDQECRGIEHQEHRETACLF
ncbi:Polyphosphate kinase [Helicobacter bizzozeronii CCUG 35545]|nr:Polyphosphate kinase [Helicobacter bizzozeronii CCUG 35545]